MRRVADAATDTSTPAEFIVDLVVAAFAGELGRASVELFVAIRNDEALRRHMLQVQTGLTQELLQLCTDLIGTNAPAQRLEPTFWMTLNLVRGTIVDEMLGRNAGRRRKIIAEWKRLASVSLQDVDSTGDATVDRHE